MEWFFINVALNVWNMGLAAGLILGCTQAHSAITITCTKSEWGPVHVETDTLP